MYQCPYCNISTNSRKNSQFPNWYHVAKHAKNCVHKTGEYVIDSQEGPIHYSVFLNNFSSDYIRYLYPKLIFTLTQIRNHFKKFDIIIPTASISWSETELVTVIKDFVLDNDRIPTNREFNNPKNNYPSVNPFIRVFGSWNNAVKAAGFESNNNLYGIINKALDGNTYRSLLESSFVNKFLYLQYNYTYEDKYPDPYRYRYDFYISSLDLYIEVAGGTSDSYIETLNKKIEINKLLNRKLLVIYNNDINLYNTLKELINGKNFHRNS